MIRRFFVTLAFIISFSICINVHADDLNDLLYDENGNRYSMGISEIETLSSIEEFKGVYNKNGINDFRDDVYDTLPIRTNNCKNAFFPSIGDQGVYGSCVAWATTYYMASYTIGKELNQKVVFSPLFTYNIAKEGSGVAQKVGTEAADEGYVYDIMSRYGNMPYSEFPYPSMVTSDQRIDALKNSTKITNELPIESYKWKNAMQYKIDDFRSLPSNDVNELKKELADGNIFVVTTVPDMWRKARTSSGENIILSSIMQKSGMGHKMTVVDYDDTIETNITVQTENGEQTYTTKGAFKLANSWGKNWGNNGFIWLAYESFFDPSALDYHGYKVEGEDIGAIANANALVVNKDEFRYEKYTPQIYAQITCDINCKSDMNLTIEVYNKITNCTEKLNPLCYSYKSDGYSGTFIADFSDLIQNFLEQSIDDVTYSIKLPEIDGITSVSFVNGRTDEILETFSNIKKGETVKYKPFSVYDPFEYNSSYDTWYCSNSASKQIMFDGSNKYLKLLSNNISSNEPCGVYKSIDIDNNQSVNIELDIQFSSSNDSILIKSADRILFEIDNYNSKIYYYTDSKKSMYAPNSDYKTTINHNRWYKIKFTKTVDKLYQIHVIDILNNEIVGSAVNLSLAGNNISIDKIVVCSEDSVLIDNVKVYNLSVYDVYISGEIYVKRGARYKYSLNMQNQFDTTTLDIPCNNWCVIGDVSGVTVNDGILTVEKNTKVGPILLCATSIYGDAYFKVNILNNQ